MSNRRLEEIEEEREYEEYIKRYDAYERQHGDEVIPVLGRLRAGRSGPLIWRWRCGCSECSANYARDRGAGLYLLGGLSDTRAEARMDFCEYTARRSRGRFYEFYHEDEEGFRSEIIH
jgi:hypothetical protein